MLSSHNGIDLRVSPHSASKGEKDIHIVKVRKGYREIKRQRKMDILMYMDKGSKNQI